MNNTMLYNWWGRLQRSHLVADFDRWTTLGSTIMMADTPAGTNIITVMPGEETKLASVNVGDPVVLRCDPAPWASAPVTNTGNNNYDYKPPYLAYSYLYALVVAVGSSSVRLSKRLEQPISRGSKPGAATDFFLRYAHQDFVHPHTDAVYALHMELWRPQTRLYDLYLGARCWAEDGSREPITQLEAGRVTVNATVTGATYSVTETTLLPGRNTTTDATFDITFTAPGSRTALPYRLCASGRQHVARAEVMAKVKAGTGGSLECFVEDADGTLLSPLVRPDMLGGVDTVSVPFTPQGSLRCRLVLRQRFADDASCYLSVVDMCELPSNAQSSFRDTFIDAYLFLQGASNSREAAPMYSDNFLTHANLPWDEQAGTGIYASGLITAGARYPAGVWTAAGPTPTGTGTYRDSVPGRPMQQQLPDLEAILAGSYAVVPPEGITPTLALPESFSLLLGIESANTINNTRKAQSTATASEIAALYDDWRTLALARGEVMFFTPTRQGRETAGLLADGFARTELDIDVIAAMQGQLQAEPSLKRYRYRQQLTLSAGVNTIETVVARGSAVTTETFTVTR